MEPTITQVQFVSDGAGIFRGPTRAMAVLSDGQSSVELFAYYPDELSFTQDELIGKTVKQAQQLRHQKDVAYLRS